MRMEVRSFQLPRWLAPLLLLFALALIPLALVAAVGLGALAVGTTVVRAFLPSSRPVVASSRSVQFPKTSSSAIDVEYEVKD